MPDPTPCPGRLDFIGARNAHYDRVAFYERPPFAADPEPRPDAEREQGR